MEGLTKEENRGLLKHASYATLIYAAITLAVFLPITLHISSVIAGSAGSPDVYQTLWEIWWVKYSIFSLHASPYYTNLLFFPIGANLATETMQPLVGLLSAPLQAVSIATAYNVFFLLGFILSGTFMFLLAYYLTKNVYAGFIAGLIFAFSPVHIAQSFSHLQWTSIEWIPLFILFFILLVRTKRRAYVIGAALSFLLLTFMGDIEQAIMVIVFALLFLLFSLFTKSKRDVLDRKLAIRLAEVIVLIVIIGSPFLIPVINGVLYGNALQNARQESNLLSSILWSDTIYSFFLPSYFNSMFTKLFPIYYNDVSKYGFTAEGFSYMGYTVIALCLIGIYKDYKAKEFLNTYIWISLFFVFAALALGPAIWISGKSYLPGIYIAYYYIPVFGLLREPGRFDFIVELCLAVMAAFGVKYILGKSRKAMPNGKVILYTAIISALILIEYVGLPYYGSIANGLFTNATSVPQAYSYLEAIPQNNSVLVLPQLSNTHVYAALSMFYQTEFKRPLLGGYITRSNLTQDFYTYAIPLVIWKQYQYPIMENYTKVNMLLISNYSIGGIVLMKSGYYGDNLSELSANLTAMLGEPEYNGSSTEIFIVKNISSDYGSIVSYISGPWIPMLAFYPEANATIDRIWLVRNSSSIIVYSPEEHAAVSISGNIFSFANVTTGIYVDNAIVGTLRTGTDSSSGYSFNASLNKGYNRIYFAIGNKSEENGFYMGMWNISIEPTNQS